MVISTVHIVVRLARRATADLLLMVMLLGCAAGCQRSPSRRPVAVPIRDSRWVEHVAAPADPTSVTTLPSEGTPVMLPTHPTVVVLPEPVTQVIAKMVPMQLESLAASIELPEPCTSLAAGAGLQESWVFDRPISGSAYGLHVSVSKQAMASHEALQAAAREVGGKDIANIGTTNGVWWVQKAPVGPVEELWAARPLGVLAVVAVCTAPPDYRAAAQATCLSLRPLREQHTGP